MGREKAEGRSARLPAMRPVGCRLIAGVVLQLARTPNATACWARPACLSIQHPRAKKSPARYHFTSSTRRFFALPSSVSFDATGA